MGVRPPTGVVHLRQLPHDRLTYGSFGTRVPRWNGQAQDITQRACIAICNALREREHLGPQHRLSGDDFGDEGELANVLGLVDSIGHEAIDKAPGESHLDPTSHDDQFVQC